MHDTTLLQNQLQKACPFVHKKRLNCLFDVTSTLVNSKKLWISALGRSLQNKTSAKHNIKKVDSLIGNVKLHSERLNYYQFFSQLLIGGKQHPIIIVDWSPISGSCMHYFLRASVTGIGRTLTIYEEVHEQSHYANDKIHKTFLSNLHSLLPADCRPIIVTDAGFRNTWFAHIQKRGWDFVGRLRYNTRVNLEGKDDWQNVKCLHSRAANLPRCLGEVSVAKSNPIAATLYIYRGKLKGRTKKTKHGKKCQSTHSKKHAKSAKEPWIIMTSLKHKPSAAKKIIRLYKYRMQIEESFRDLKNHRDGFRLPESGTKSSLRLENLLLIALLATFILWLAGQVAIQQKWHYQIQANTIRNRAVLSIAFLGAHVLANSHRYKLFKKELLEAWRVLPNLVVTWENIDCI